MTVKQRLLALCGCVKGTPWSRATKETDSGHLRIPLRCWKSGEKPGQKKKAKKDMFLSDVAGQILKFIIRYKNKQKKKQNSRDPKYRDDTVPALFSTREACVSPGGPDRENRY